MATTWWHQSICGKGFKNKNAPVKALHVTAKEIGLKDFQRLSSICCTCLYHQETEPIQETKATKAWAYT